MKKYLLLLLLLLTANAFAQFSKTHYIPPLSNSTSISADQQYLYISTPSLADVNFRIINLGGTVVNGTVSRDNPYVYAITNYNESQLIVRSNLVNSVISNKGFIVEADDLVYVTARVIASGGYHAGSLVSKGLAALGNEFRVGAMTNADTPNYGTAQYTFISVLATENNTTVLFSDFKDNIQLFQNEVSGSSDISVVLNSGESYVIAVQGPNQANRDGLIGTRVSSDKPIAMACGSFGGTNGEMSNIDLGFDQAVPSSRVGKEYIFIKSTGLDNVERVLLVANEDNTEVFLNGSSISSYTLSAGEYVSLNGSSYTPQGNLYVETSKNVFAYQSVGDDSQPNQANQEMFFVPPLSCQTPKIIDNIPFINQIGDIFFTGRITLVTETGSTLNFIINGVPYVLADLPSNITIDGPLTVSGRPDFVTYTLSGLSGNVSVYSTSQLYLASYGTFANATFGGFYSGFTYKPSISFSQIDVNQSSCFPNIKLSVSEASGFDSYEWFFNGNLVSTSTQYVPTAPGYYYVKATLAACGTTLESDLIPVSVCTSDLDEDGANDNIDLDHDNDGITNCEESFGDLPLNFSNPAGASFSIASYSNSFIGTVASSILEIETPFTGNADGSFVTKTGPSKGDKVSYSMNFAEPVSIKLDYVSQASAGTYLNSNAEFTINSSEQQTLTLLNPDNQLLVDTNYDGFYESGVTKFSSFEIRFRLNSTTPLTPGSGTFSIQTYLATNLIITHKNLSEITNSATFRVQATCVPRDSDGDGVFDYMDQDSDNDGIPDIFEAQASAVIALSGIDTNGDGIDDVFGNGISPSDTDSDGVPNYLDLDSDNDGIYDVVESGTLAPNNNGVISLGISLNGMANAIQTSANSGVLNYTIRDTDSDGLVNAYDLDSDGDKCNDVVEAGFTDNNNNGMLGNNIPTVNIKGIVTSALNGYTTPNPNYIIATPIEILQEIPTQIIICEGDSAVISIGTNNGVTFQWQVSTNGMAFNNIVNGGAYSGTTTNELTINAAAFTLNGNVYRVLLSKIGNICGSQSGEVNLIVNPLPATVTKRLVQCEVGSNPDGITTFNLSQANAYFTNGNADVQIEYFASMADAQTGTNPLPLIYTNVTNPQSIVAKVSNSTCANYSILNLESNMLPSQIINLPAKCDDDGLEDGFYVFNLTAPFTADARYFETENDALFEQNEIANPTSYTNLSPYQPQTLFVRRESNNECISITLLNIVLNKLPTINANLNLEPHVVCVNSTIFTTTIDAEILDGSSPDDYTYQWFFEGNTIVGENNYNLTVSQQGTYSVIVTNIFGCTKTRIIPVIASSAAIIESIEATGFLENNTVTVYLTNNSYGNYVYSLDYQNAFQSSNVLTNVLPGFHTIYIKDLNGCAVTSQLVSVLGIPKYFTPNGDGFHDTWNIQGVGYAFHPETITYVYDRYGKLLKQILATDPGWDGTFNGYALPSDDYWYIITLDDGRIFKGHFTLKR